ncbi:SDR family oxidoreductase [Burkholderia plantarii]|uniref:SDR family oxidoreductase n=1 Tax=Burkholderia plantarii TaxID=41899 RepID=UPI0006D89F34|nr:SDR family NAD(P)-dependent oxidoreductase [Burkholderia plantarii]ALK34974.1 short-chain dehydrogenase/reductase SDR [Burkholderia plantarii]GLZ19055.1 oxidoreductase [Burkholderia plantarii]
MKLSGNTILITGGTSGIGLALAERLHALDNRVIVAGRDEAALAALRERLPGLAALRADVGDPDQVRRLHEQVLQAFPATNQLINCAGIMRKLDLQRPGFDLADVTREVQTNLNGTIWMSLQFIAHLKRRPNAAIVNVSSGLAFVPMPISPVYSASKAAVHAFTLSLRAQLSNTAIRVFELAPPGTDTPLFHGDFSTEETAGVKPMPVATLADRALAGLRRDVLEIRPGLANVLKLGSRLAPRLLLKQTSRSVALMHRDNAAGYE